MPVSICAYILGFLVARGAQSTDANETPASHALARRSTIPWQCCSGGPPCEGFIFLEITFLSQHEVNDAHTWEDFLFGRNGVGNMLVREMREELAEERAAWEKHQAAWREEWGLQRDLHNMPNASSELSLNPCVIKVVVLIAWLEIPKQGRLIVVHLTTPVPGLKTTHSLNSLTPKPQKSPSWRYRRYSPSEQSTAAATIEGRHVATAPNRSAVELQRQVDFC
ncbi:hypothetical protein DFH27DRAFT_609913 [Peziza echinospora]|nr:hypothetical protein DFH27DRAFT_609913 [Peziza echinospora]